MDRLDDIFRGPADSVFHRWQEMRHRLIDPCLRLLRRSIGDSLGARLHLRRQPPWYVSGPP